MAAASKASDLSAIKTVAGATIKTVAGATAQSSMPLGSTEHPLFQFGLRQLMWFVAGVSLVLAAVTSIRGLSGMAVLLATIVVSVHVFATTVATRLRSRTNRMLAENAASDGERSSINAARPECAVTLRFEAPSPWQIRGGSTSRWIPRLIAAAIVLGGLGGIGFFACCAGGPHSPAGLALGAISFSVLGGWSAFLGGSFYAIFRNGLRQALAEQRRLGDG